MIAILLLGLTITSKASASEALPPQDAYGALLPALLWGLVTAIGTLTGLVIHRVRQTSNIAAGPAMSSKDFANLSYEEQQHELKRISGFDRFPSFDRDVSEWLDRNNPQPGKRK